MCLTVNNGATFKVAEEDMIVYKVGKINGNIFQSKFRYYLYTKDKVQEKVPLKFYGERFPLDREIYEGYHSYTNISDAKMATGKIGTFTIPKGTLYIEGTFIGFKSYVSETIIFNGEYKSKLLRTILQLLKK